MRIQAKAFTLLELLLVITLLSLVITTVVLGLKNASIKGKVSRIASDASELRKVTEEIAYQEDSGYSNICAVEGGSLNTSYPKLDDIKKDINKMGGKIYCYSDKDNYCISIKLPGRSNQFFCLDSEGSIRKVDGNPCTAPNSTCPLNP